MSAVEWGSAFVVERDASGAIAVPVLVFDGSCGFCTWAVRWARKLDRQSRFNYVPFQFLTRADFARLNVHKDRCGREIVLVDEQRQASGGAAAANAYLLASGAPVARLIARLRLPPAVFSLEAAAYRFVARNRIAISRVFGTAKYALVESAGDAPDDERAFFSIEP